MCLVKTSQTKAALGGDVTLGLITGMSSSETESLFNLLWKKIFKFEIKFSRFLLSSELTKFNRSAGIKTVVSSEFKELLISAQIQSVRTSGLYNPFITPALQRAGYIKSALVGYEQDKQIDYTDRKIVDVDRLIIGDDWALIPYGTAIDLGGCGKGYLADKLAEILNDYGIAGYWLSLGGDVVVKGHDENGDALTLAIQDASDLSSTINWLIECPQNGIAVATSGTFKRQGQNIPHSWHHIIDPTTKKPAVTDIRLVTVCTDSGIDADVLASCAIILGSKKAPDYLKNHGVKSALLQCIDNNGNSFKVKFGPNFYKSHSNVVEEVLINA